MYLPDDIAQQAIDASGVDFMLGDITDGSRPSQVILRAYEQCIRQLLRGANWDFCRKTVDLIMLADATGNTANVGTVVPVPWTYEYSYPVDCVKARFVPWNYWQSPGVPAGNITPPNPSSPLTTGNGQVLTGQRIRPAPFVIATDPNYPPSSQIPYDTPGISPDGNTVILTNVKNAKLVYTAYMRYPSVWDSQFRAALVSYLASEIALPLATDKKLGLAMRQQNILVFKAKLEQARITNGNESWSSSNLAVDWMRARWTGGAGGWGNNFQDGGGPANAWGGFDSVICSDGSAY